MRNNLDYNETDEILNRAGAEHKAAEAHGLTCGLVCGDFPHSLQTIQRELLEECDPQDAFVQECRGLLTQLHGIAKEELDDPELSFQLMLPDEDSGTMKRAAALSDWCQGFLYGFGISATDIEKRLSDDATGALEDMGEFTRLDRDEVDDTDNVGAEALAELEEYLRVCVMVIYQDMQHNKADTE